jgi:HlyD family secretion protein
VAAALAVYAFRTPPADVELASVTRGPLEVTVGDEGRTRIRDIYVVSAPVAGAKLRIEMDPGDPVIANKTRLATLLPVAAGFLDARAQGQAQAALTQAIAEENRARAALAQARADLILAQKELRRSKALPLGQTVSEQKRDIAQRNLDAAAARRDQARASLAAAKAGVAAARATLISPAQPAAAPTAQGQPLEIRAPVSGRVLRVLAESAAVVAAGAPLMEIGDPRNLEIAVDLLSQDAVRVSPGDAVIIENWGGPRPLSGRVRRIEPSGFTKISALGVEEQRVYVIIDFTDPPETWQSLQDAYRVEVRIVVWRAEKVLRVPVSALFRQGEGWSVFVDKNGQARRQAVTIGAHNAVLAEVRAGLRDGERVIVHPGEAVHDGVRLHER